MVTVLALVDIALRLSAYGSGPSDAGDPGALDRGRALVAVGATFGGTLVFDYGFNVETAGDSPVWHNRRPTSCPAHDTSEHRAPCTSCGRGAVDPDAAIRGARPARSARSRSEHRRAA